MSAASIAGQPRVTNAEGAEREAAKRIVVRRHQPCQWRPEGDPTHHHPYRSERRRRGGSGHAILRGLAAHLGESAEYLARVKALVRARTGADGADPLARGLVNRGVSHANDRRLRELLRLAEHPQG